MSSSRRVDPALFVLLGGAALLIPACTSLLGTFEIGEAGGSGGSGGGAMTTSSGSGSPQGATVLVPAAGQFAHARSVSAASGVVAVGGTFSGHGNVNPMMINCAGAKSCGFVARFDVFSSSSPTAKWVTSFHGATLTDVAVVRSVAVDAGGYTYVAGSYSGSMSIGDASPVAPAFGDKLQHAFFTRLGPDGSPQWAKVNAIGGASVATSIAAGPDQSFIVGGDFTKTMALSTCGTFTVGVPTSSFVLKLDPGGDTCKWGVQLVGPDVAITAVNADFGGNALVTGSHVHSFGVLPTNATLEAASSQGGDLFVAKLDTMKKGNVVWLVGAEATLGAAGAGVAAIEDSAQGYGVIVTGKLGGDAFSQSKTCGVSAKPGASSLVARLDNSTGACVWAKSFAGETAGLAVDGKGDLVVTGNFTGSTTFGAGSLLASGPDQAAFIAKLSSLKGDHLWSRGLVTAKKGEKITATSVAGDSGSGHWLIAGELDGSANFGLMSALGVTDGGFLLHLGN